LSDVISQKEPSFAFLAAGVWETMKVMLYFANAITILIQFC